MPERPIKILFEASKLYQNRSDGVKRYITELLQEMYLQTLDDHRVEIDLLFGKHIIPLHEFYIQNEEGIIRNPNMEMDDTIRFKAGIIMNLLYFFGAHQLSERIFTFYQSRYYPIFLTRLTKLGKGRYGNIHKNLESYDYIHVPLPQNMLFFKYIPTHFIVTLHDISHLKFPQYHTQDNITRAERGMEVSLEKKAKFISVSHSTAKDCWAAYAIPSNQIKTIHEGVNPKVFYPLQAHEKIDFPYKNIRYFLAIGTLEPRKNVLKIIKAFEALRAEHKDLHLIIIGSKGWKDQRIRQKLKNKNSHLNWIRKIDDITLRIFYIHTLSLVYPSYYEGFGLPLLESMACGTPVIFGDNSSMPEVAEKGGIGVVADDKASIQKAMLTMLDEKVRHTLAQQALEQSRKLTWKNTAEQTIDFYWDNKDKTKN